MLDLPFTESPFHRRHLLPIIETRLTERSARPTAPPEAEVQDAGQRSMGDWGV